MTESVTISTTKSSFPDYLDFQKLRAAGLEHIQELGSDLWTDYNLHDPGITILEVLCYALTDLGFRTNFDIKDLLTRSPEARLQAGTTSDGKPYDDNFYTAEQILTCNPVTLLDLRKLLIDIPGVRNAWLERATEAEVEVYINTKKDRLQYTLPNYIDPANEDDVDEATLKLKGLYIVCLDLDVETQIDACGEPYTSVSEVLEEVYAVLHRHRNLCEDFLDVVILGDEQIGLCADIELKPEADPEEALLGIYTAVQEFLAPTIEFFSLQEMLKKGKSIESIFEGRPLSPRSHGFIDVETLKKAELRETLYASDLYQEIMDVEGVLAIRKLVFSNYVNDLPQTQGEKWCLKLTPKHRPRMDLDKSPITFYKGLLPFSVDKKEVQRRYNEEKAASTKALLEAHQLDLPVPEGTHRPLDDYYSIQHDFPEVYGIGENGLKPNETQKRKAQARQLKAYLLFFDQILANYLAQLGNVRELFSMRPDEACYRKQGRKNRTYFTQLLEGVPRLKELLRNFNRCESRLAITGPESSYQFTLLDDDGDELLAGVETFSTRRELVSAFEKFLVAAGNAANYNRLSGLPGDTPFGFELLDAGGAPLATHPITYADAATREQAIAALTEYACADPLTLQAPGTSTPSDYPDYLDYIAESVETYHDRRNRFLDHLMGRFAESFTDYVLLMYTINGKKHDNARIIQDKTDFLGSYPEISRNRGKGFNYTETPVWNTENVAGLQKRVSKLVGIDDVSRRTLGHCDVVAAGPMWHFVFSIPTDVPDSPFEIESKQGYPTEDAARQAYRAFLALARHEANYQRLAYQGTKTRYGFLIVDENGACMAESPERFSSRAERDARLFSVISHAGASELVCRVVQTEECYEFQLYDATGTVLLFTAARGTPTAAAAREAFEAIFLPKALDAACYQDIDAEGAFGFVLMTAEVGGQPLAYHDHTYATAQERDDRKQAIIYYLDDEPPRFGTEGPPGQFDFEVRDNTGTLLFVNSAVHPTEAAALETYQEVVRQAPFRVHYRLRDDLGEAAPFGFELLDRRENLIAVHPTAYETDIARDLALDGIIHLLCEDDDIRFEIEETGGVFSFELMNLGGETLLLSENTFPTEAEAVDAFQAFLVLAADEDRYALVEEGTEEVTFGFVLTNADDATVATHPTFYATETERDLAIRSIINYVRPAELEFEVSGEVGILHFVLLGEEDRVLFRSIATYPDEETARQAFDDFLVPARQRERYHELPDFGFELQDEAEQTLAEHPQTYASDAEREAAIALILAYVRDDAVVSDVVNVAGAYFFEMRDEAGTLWLAGTRTLDGVPEAEAACRAAIERAKDVSAYHDIDGGPGNCPYSFALLDAEGDVIARHLRGYTSEAERDAAKRRLLYIVLDGSDVASIVEGSGSTFRFKVVDPLDASYVLFESDETYASEAEAEAAFEDIFVPAAGDAANYTLLYDNANCTYGFSLENAEGTVTNRLTYGSSRERDEQVEALAFYVTQQTIQCVPHGTDCGYYFEIGLPGQPSLFVSEARYPSETRAWSACNALFPLLTQIERYAVVEDDEGGLRLVIQDEEGEAQAGYQDRDAAPEDGAGEDGGPEDDGPEAARVRLQALAEEIVRQAMRARQVDHDAVSKDSGYRFQLDGPQGAVVFTSARLYASEDEAWDAAETFCERVQDTANFRLITSRFHCLYGFELTDGAGRTMAVHDRFYATATARDDALNTIAEWVDDEGLHLVEHLLLRPRKKGETPVYHFELINEQTEVPLFRSVASYDEEADALADLRRILARILSGDQGVFQPFTVKTDGNTCHGFRLVDGGQILAEHESYYPDSAAREAAIEALAAYVQALFEEVLDEDVNRFGTGEDAGVAIDTLLQVDLGVAARIERFIVSSTSPQDELSDGFLPLDACCLDDEGMLCPVGSDPYSFRATVVLPYWPERFRNVSFRNFFERTIRAETPAHIFLRICWVDVCQMRAFEAAYRWWLQTLATPGDDCAATSALNRLIDVLTRLRNVYPEAILRGCDEGGDGSAIILNQTLLGNASFTSDESN